jgi:hypothetical protein
VGGRSQARTHHQDRDCTCQPVPPTKLKLPFRRRRYQRSKHESYSQFTGKLPSAQIPVYVPPQNIATSKSRPSTADATTAFQTNEHRNSRPVVICQALSSSSSCRMLTCRRSLRRVIRPAVPVRLSSCCCYDPSSKARRDPPTATGCIDLAADARTSQPNGKTTSIDDDDGGDVS